VYQNRISAGKVLLKEISERGIDTDASFLFAVPRGGVEVAYPIALALRMPIVPVIVHKVPASYNRELAIGAVSIFGDTHLNEIAKNESIDYLDSAVKETLKDVKMRERKFGVYFDFNKIKDKIVLLVDDGIATGETLFLAATGLKRFNPKKIYVLVPVSSVEGYNLLSAVSEVISLIVDPGFVAVSAYFEEFPQLSEEQTKRYIQNSLMFASNGA
jgi:putative phosphoribosyl transferase